MKVVTHVQSAEPKHEIIINLNYEMFLKNYARLSDAKGQYDKMLNDKWLYIVFILKYHFIIYHNLVLQVNRLGNLRNKHNDMISINRTLKKEFLLSVLDLVLF